MPSSSGLIFPKFHQVAMYCPDHNMAIQSLRMFGYTKWVHDEALLVGKDDHRMKAKMSFCYHFLGQGLELEVFTYDSGSNRYYDDVDLHDMLVPVISHMGAHVDDADHSAKYYSERLGVDIVHEFDTYNHTNPAIARQKRFREAIIDTRHLFGYDIKFIQQLDYGPWEV